jgi:hypothetical protein
LWPLKNSLPVIARRVSAVAIFVMSMAHEIASLRSQ